MTRFLIPIITLLLAVLIYIGSVAYDHARVPSRSITSAPISPMPSSKSFTTLPDFSVKTLGGRTIHINDLRGSVVILNFWATWCAPCVTEFPDLLDIVDQYKGDVILLALSSDLSTPPIQKFIDNQFKKRGHPLNKKNVIIARDESRNITRDIFHIDTYPESLIIGRDGQIARHIIGIDDWGTAETQNLIKNLVKNPKSN